MFIESSLDTGSVARDLLKHRASDSCRTVLSTSVNEKMASPSHDHESIIPADEVSACTYTK